MPWVLIGSMLMGGAEGDVAARAAAIEDHWNRCPGLYVKVRQAWTLLTPTKETRFFEPAAGLYGFAFQGSKRLVETWSESNAGREFSALAFNGETYFQGNGKDHSRSQEGFVSDFLLRANRDNLRDDCGFYFECVGMPTYEGRRLVARREHRLIYASIAGHSSDEGRSYSVANCLEKGGYQLAGQETINGTPCDRLESPSDTLWLDPARGDSLIKRRLLWDSNGPVHLEILTSGWQDVGQGYWLPFEIERKLFTVDGTIVRSSSRLAVEHVELGPFPPEKFELRPLPGATVNDETRLTGRGGAPIGITYREAETPAETAKRIDAQEATYRMITGEQWSIQQIVLVANVMILAALVVFWVVRRGRGKGSEG